jgi:hypothetical protein
MALSLADVGFVANLAYHVGQSFSTTFKLVGNHHAIELDGIAVSD